MYDTETLERLTALFKDYYTARRAAWTQGQPQPDETDYVLDFIHLLNGGPDECRTDAANNMA